MMPHWPLAGDADYTPPHFELGYKSVRFEDIGVKFGQLTSAIGVYSNDVLIRFDQLVALYEAAGVRIYLELGGHFQGVLPSDEHWDEYVTVISSRYGNRIDYGLGNEHDTGPYFPGTWTDSFRFCSIASPIIRANAPRAKIYSVSTTSAGAGYLDAFLAQGGAALIDAVGFHPYVQPLRPERMINVARTFRNVMQTRGIGSLPLICTEVGWHQYFLNNVLVNPSQWDPDSSDVPMPNDLAAAYLVRENLALFAAGVEAVYHFCLDDYLFSMIRVVDKDNRVNLDAAGLAYAVMAETLAGTTLGNYRASGSQDFLHFIDWSKGGQRGRVLWSIDNASHVADLSRYSEGFDMYGEPITLSAAYAVTNPIYVIG